MGYTRSAIKGVSWMTVLQTVIRILTFLKIAVLARVLTPTQFGIFGIAALVLALLEILTETGINVILIQSKDSIEEYLDSAWVASILRGILICLGIVVSAPFITNFFNNPQALGIIMLISLAPLIKGFINPAEIIFQKDLKFRSEFMFRTSLYFIDALVAIVVALITHSVYSLAFGLIAAALLEVILSFVFIKIWPKLEFNRNYLWEIFHKGKWVTGFSIFNYFGENGDDIAIGKFLGATPLGAYQMAYKLAITPITEIADVINKVIFPVFSKIGNDKKRLLLAFLKTTLINAIAAISLGLVIFTFPREVIGVILGSKWLYVAPVLKILAIFGILRALFSPISVLFLATGNQMFLTVFTFARFIILMLLAIPLVLKFNIVGAAYSQLLSTILSIPILIYFAVKIFKTYEKS
jgi:O-antigen/teichoic acid export membrane protein